MKKLSICLFTLVLTGCGGGGGDTQPATAIVKSESSAAPSSLLADNPANANANFNQFSDYTLNITPSEFGFSAQTVFLKVYTRSQSSDDEQVLFLGKVSGQQAFNIHVPKSVSYVYLDMFSGVSGDPQITEEVKL